MRDGGEIFTYQTCRFSVLNNRITLLFSSTDSKICFQIYRDLPHNNVTGLPPQENSHVPNITEVPFARASSYQDIDVAVLEVLLLLPFGISYIPCCFSCCELLHRVTLCSVCYFFCEVISCSPYNWVLMCKRSVFSRRCICILAKIDDTFRHIDEFSVTRPVLINRVCRRKRYSPVIKHTS